MSIFGLRADEELQAALRKHSGGLVRKHTSSGWLFRQGEKPSGFYLIESGRARIFMESTNGTSLFEEVIDSGCVVGLPATVNGNPYSLSCEVVADTEVLFVPREKLVKLMRSDANSAMKLLDLLSTEVQAVRAELGNFAERGGAQSSRAKSEAI
jgi:CRP/FNR family transcriptional regulator